LFVFIMAHAPLGGEEPAFELMLHEERLVPAAGLVVGIAAADLVIEVVEPDQQAVGIMQVEGVEPAGRVAVGGVYGAAGEQSVEVLLPVFAVAQLQPAVPGV